MDEKKLLNSLNPEIKAQFYSGAYKLTIMDLCNFYETKLVPQFELLEYNPKHTIITKIYQRMFFHLTSLVKLDDSCDYQAVGSITRSLFEFYLDIIMINNYEQIEAKGKMTRILDKYNYYANISNYILYKYYSKIDINKIGILRGGRRFLSDYIPKANIVFDENETKLLNLYHEIWGRNGEINITTWHGIDRFRQADILEMKDMYFMLYKYFSWFTHSCPTGLSGIDSIQADVFNCRSKEIAIDIFIEATRIIVDELQLKLENEDINKIIDDFVDEPMRIIYIILKEKINENKNINIG